MEDVSGDLLSHSGEFDLSDGRLAESIDVDRTPEKRWPSSATPSPENPPHSSRLLLSIGVPRPAYFINGQEPRAPAGAVAERFAEDDDFFDFLEDLFVVKGPK